MSTLSLSPDEWKSLLLSNLAQAHSLVSNSAAINRDGVKFLAQHLERTKALAAAWEAVCPKQDQVQEPVAESAPMAPEAQANGNGAAPKRKGGWPRGKPRKRQSAQEAMQ